MAKRAFLLALSGSEQSRYAAEVCWDLARQTGARVTAQHVIDTETIKEVIVHEKPGLIGTYPFAETYHTVCSMLHALGKKLIDVYTVSANKAGVEGDTVIDEGEPVHEICRRATEHDLVIMGHQPSAPSDIEPDRRQFRRASIAEGLAHMCTRPLLVVQKRCRPWSNMRIVISIEHINESYVNACLNMAESLSMKPQVLCLAMGVHAEDPCKFITNLRKDNPRLADVPIQVKEGVGVIVEDNESWWLLETDIESESLSDTLIMLPTRALAGERITILGSCPDVFIRQLTLPSILLWPEEEAKLEVKPKKKGTAASSGR